MAAVHYGRVASNYCAGMIVPMLRGVKHRVACPPCTTVLTRSASRYSTSPKPRVAVLYQELEPPLINGVRKPKKLGEYRDSGADIAYVLKHQCNLHVISTVPMPDPQNDGDWCFGDTEQGIMAAISQDVTHLWANTILFANYPLQTSASLAAILKSLKIVAQPPNMVELFDDKSFVNNLLRAQPGFALPRARDVYNEKSLDEVLRSRLYYPIVAKPVRGRGSYGVKVCYTPEVLHDHCRELLNQQTSVIVEDFLAGQEATITVMPPSPGYSDYWAMPVVERFNHAEGKITKEADRQSVQAYTYCIPGIAPYNGVVAVMQNSRCISSSEHESYPEYKEIQRQCVKVAKLLQCTAPIRVDVRRSREGKSSPFALFDVVMKPNMTGSGRPGRENQASLTALAAEGIGWTYSTLLMKILEASSPLHDLRNVKLSDAISG